MSSCCYHTRDIRIIFTLFSSLLVAVPQKHSHVHCATTDPLSISRLLSFHAVLPAGIFYLPLPVTPQVLMICEASLHEKKQAVNGSFVPSLLRQMLFLPENQSLVTLKARWGHSCAPYKSLTDC